MKAIVMIISVMLLSIPVIAQENNEKGKKDKNLLSDITKNMLVSAYFQAQYQHGQKDVNRLGVGSNNENLGEKSFNRYGLRRAYVSTLYETGIVYGLITLEIKDRGIWFSDAFINITDPWTKRFSFCAGSINPNFGYELSISPSLYELPEGTPYIYNLFPDIYDIGAQLSYKAPEKFANLNARIAMVAGNGIKQETDSRRDFVGSINLSTNTKNPVSLSGGFSYYNGSVYQGTENVYKMRGNEFVLDSNPENIGKYAKREYFDLNTQLKLNTCFGLTQLRGEYTEGTQPASKLSNGSPNSNTRPETDTYIRKFRGGYIYYLQQIGPKLPLTFWGGCSWHNPNTKVSGDNIGLHNTNSTDIKYQILSLGLIWFPYPSIKIQAFYEMPFNEKSVNLDGFNRSRKENVLTLRIQYKY